MTGWAHAAALCCVAAGVVAGAAVAVAARSGRTGLRVALDFWLGAGLLNLTAADGWRAPLVAAVVLAVRQTAGLAIRSPGADLRDLLPARREPGTPGDAP